MSKEKTYRELQFENDFVIVWKTVISPETPLQMHRHDRARVIVPLKEGKVQKFDNQGKSQEIFLEAHKAYWLDADPFDGFHGNVNLGNEPLEVMVIEMKASQNCTPPSLPIY